MSETKSHSVSIAQIAPNLESVAAALAAVLGKVGKLPTPNSVWAVKLNLTYPTYLPGVVNSPVFLEGLCRWAREYRVTLQFVEGDGGNGAYSAEDAFEGNGIAGIARAYGMQCVSISEKPWIWKETLVGDARVRLPYSPFFERREYDAFITAPVFKNHVFTIVSLGMKNLWGCIPDAYRMYYHHILDPGIVALQIELKADFSIFDGHIALRGAGPMDGKPFELNAVMASSDVGTGEKAALEIMTIPISRVRHLQLAEKAGVVPQEITWLDDPAPFRRDDFVLERSLIAYLSIYAGKFPALQRLIYHSPLSSSLYAIVDRFRPNSAQAALVQAKRAGKYTPIDIDEEGR